MHRKTRGCADQTACPPFLFAWVNAEMLLSEYRRRLSDYQTAIARDLFLYRMGRQGRSEGDAILREHSDLFNLAAIEELRGQEGGAGAYRESERIGIRRLLALAMEGQVAWRVREMTEEIGRLEMRGVAAAVSGELDDLLRERFARMGEAAISLGYPSNAALRGELRGIEYDRLVPMAERLLALTEAVYRRSISELLARELSLSLDGATVLDLRRLERWPWGERHLRHERRGEIYRELFRGLGFRTEQQSNLELIFRPPEGDWGSAECFPLRTPEEVKLFVPVGSGQWGERSFWQAVGAAQSFAWTSSSLPPEFRYVTPWGDRALELAWGLLFENLLLDASWLMGTFGLVESLRFRQSQAALRLLNLRRHAAQSVFEYEFFSGKLVGTAADRYAESMGWSWQVEVEGREYPRSISPTLTSADYLRAAAFEAQLREYLKSAFGAQWWTSRKAGEMLIDLWNTGQRHGVEEIASLIGLGKPDYDWLAEDLRRTV